MKSRALICFPLIVLALAAMACGSSATVTPQPAPTQPPSAAVPTTVPATAVSTAEASPTAAPALAATVVPQASDTAVPSLEPTLAPAGPSATKDANLRAGPGTAFDKVGAVKAGEALQIVGKNPAGDWYQLAGGAWIAAFLVANAPAAVPVAAAIPTEAPPPISAGSKSGTVPQPNAFTCVGGCAVAPDPSCNIKGNVNSKGEKIYHMPGWRDYKRTDVKPEEGDRWFCNPDEARAAGFRPAQQ